MIGRVIDGLCRRMSKAPAEPLPEAPPPAAGEPTSEETGRIEAELLAGHPIEAARFARELSSRFPQSTQVQCRLGELLLAAGNARQALEVFDHALNSEPDHVSSLIGQASAYSALGEVEEAIDSLQIALAHKPDALTALLELAHLYEQSFAWREAIPLLEHARGLEPKRSDIWVRLAAAHDACEGFDRAAEAYALALVVDDSCIAAWVNLGMLHLERFGDASRAQSLFAQALARDPGCHPARANLGLALQEQGRFDEALLLYEEAI